jgi:orotidine-5'-phosphate decarboxylase
MTPQEAAKRIIVALDSTDPAAIMNVVRQLGPHVGMVKVGLEAYVALGPGIVHEIHKEQCSVFLDLKFEDIPNTVAGAVRAATQLGVAALNVHVAAGEEAMRAAVKARDDAWKIHPLNMKQAKPLLLGVTVLTSLKHKHLVKAGAAAAPKPNIGPPDRVEVVTAAAEDKALKEIVRTRAVFAKECGLDGIISSPQEIALVREACGKEFLIVTPGVRPEWAATNDQNKDRVMPPGEAVLAGADYLVIGRPILKPPPLVGSPQMAAQLIVKEICAAKEAAHVG